MRPLVFFGTTNLDIVFFSENLPTVGQSLMGTIEEFGGGKGANQAVAAARLGGAPLFATMIGEDDAADALTRSLSVSKARLKRRLPCSSRVAPIWCWACGT